MPDLVRFGVAMDRRLLKDFDALVDVRGVTRSELLRDLVRAEISRTRVAQGAPAVASLTLVYDHHIRDLTEKLTAIQHELGDQVTSSMHVHLDDAYCMEVIILRGRSDELQRVAERLLATRGVIQGGIQIVTELRAPAAGRPHRHGPGAPLHTHPRTHEPRRKRRLA